MKKLHGDIDNDDIHLDTVHRWAAQDSRISLNQDRNGAEGLAEKSCDRCTNAVSKQPERPIDNSNRSTEETFRYSPVQALVSLTLDGNSSSHIEAKAPTIASSRRGFSRVFHLAISCGSKVLQVLYTLKNAENGRHSPTWDGLAARRGRPRTQRRKYQGLPCGESLLAMRLVNRTLGS
ncbi:hypothetical protein HN011_011157 [Eciton burchellii]|nr:hypothetical protein HN011_011157 [Eciton burchellii]